MSKRIEKFEERDEKKREIKEKSQKNKRKLDRALDLPQQKTIDLSKNQFALL